MNFYNSIADAWAATLFRVMTEGGVDTVRQGGRSRRVLGHTFRLCKPERIILKNDKRKFSERYGCGELCWYLTPTPTLQQIMHYAPSYDKFASDDYGFYGKRLGTALWDASIELRKNPYSRRIVTSMWTAEDLRATDKQDIPCTLHWQWLADKGKLNLISTMRSNDAWLGMPNDIFVNCMVLMIMTNITGMELGWYQHQVGDMHLYEKDWDIADNITGADFDEVPFTPSTYPGQMMYTWEHVKHVLHHESLIREGATVGHLPSFINPLLDYIIEKVKS